VVVNLFQTWLIALTLAFGGLAMLRSSDQSCACRQCCHNPATTRQPRCHKWPSLKTFLMSKLCSFLARQNKAQV